MLSSSDVHQERQSSPIGCPSMHSDTGENMHAKKDEKGIFSLTFKNLPKIRSAFCSGLPTAGRSEEQKARGRRFTHG